MMTKILGLEDLAGRGERILKLRIMNKNALLLSGSCQNNLKRHKQSLGDEERPKRRTKEMVDGWEERPT
jgi:hypothetical protein